MKSLNVSDTAPSAMCRVECQFSKDICTYFPFKRPFFYEIFFKSNVRDLFELMFPIFSKLIGVKSGDSGGISVTGETPKEQGFRDEEAHRTPHGTRPLGTEISVYQDSLSFIAIYKKMIIVKFHPFLLFYREGDFISSTSYIVQPINPNHLTRDKIHVKFTFN